MKTIDDFFNNLKEFEVNVDKYVRTFIEKDKNYILGRLKRRLYNYGLDGSNSPIGEYAESTKKSKESKGQQSKFVTLRDTGAWYRSIDINLLGSEIYITADPQLTAELMEKYSSRILGLTPEDEEWVVTEILDRRIQEELDKIKDFDLYENT